MLFSIGIFVISLSIDALGVGLVYGMKDIRIPCLYKLIICFFSMFYAQLSLIMGSYLSNYISNSVANYLGIGILLFLGIYSILKSLSTPDNSISIPENTKNCREEESLLKVVLKPLGISIHVIRNSSYIDVNRSGNIDFYESLLLGFALSLDSIGASIGFALLDCNLFFLPIALGIGQLIFLNTGLLLGNKLNSVSSNFINTKIISLLPGILLILLAICKI